MSEQPTGITWNSFSPQQQKIYFDQGMQAETGPITTSKRALIAELHLEALTDTVMHLSELNTVNNYPSTE